ncbi:MAG: hypothetical protein J6S30_04850 [Kiritimatiellae bacterium]|nr:hypothetical protein [Kiritimatiellia bacterium]
MNPEQIIPEEKPIIAPAANAVSIYNNDALDDFPVLKAFQQYVDAEHTKAQRRLLAVSAFFTMLIIVIIGVFLFVVMNIRKDPSSEATIKALTENNNALQRQMMEQSAKMNEQLMAQLSASRNISAPQPAINRQSEVTQAQLESAVEMAKLKAELEHLKKDSAKELELREAQIAEQEKRLKAETEKRLKVEEEMLKDALAAEKRLKAEQEKHKAALAAERRLKEVIVKKPAKSTPKEDNVDKFLEELDILLDEVEKGKPQNTVLPEVKAPPAEQVAPEKKPSLNLGDSGWTIPLE